MRVLKVCARGIYVSVHLILLTVVVVVKLKFFK